MKTKNILIVAVVGLSGAVAYLLLRKKPQQVGAMPTISDAQTNKTVSNPIKNDEPSQIIRDAEKDQFNLLLKKYRLKENEIDALQKNRMINLLARNFSVGIKTKKLKEIEQELNDLGYFKKGLTFVKQ